VDVSERREQRYSGAAGNNETRLSNQPGGRNPLLGPQKKENANSKTRNKGLELRKKKKEALQMSLGLGTHRI
jgi:hypothetical protein